MAKKRNELNTLLNEIMNENDNPKSLDVIISKDNLNENTKIRSILTLFENEYYLFIIYSNTVNINNRIDFLNKFFTKLNI